MNVLNTNHHKKGKKKKFEKKKKYNGKGSFRKRKDVSRVQCFRCNHDMVTMSTKSPDIIKKHTSYAKVRKKITKEDYE